MNTRPLQLFILKTTKYNDVVLGALVVAIISIMILPVSTQVIDGLIALNLTLAICLIMLVIYIPTALSLSTFPSILLFTTLFRLSLGVTTTRQILLNAYAGDVINTFGNFVVGGNLIVGGVVFLIITIVQFLVIAKGAERVAEVGARFTLDAMPGKQMSIDADLRAGAIDMAEAQTRRNRVEKESQLYGAMDGAMKFVKGDAIAGLVIIVINLLGGIGIGMLQRGMGAAEALETYSILTIGDGLVTQIPALLISTTAGIITTRVSAEDDAPNLGEEISTQFMAQPRSLLISGVVIAAFSLVPGFPVWQFLLIGGCIGLLGFTLQHASSVTTKGEESPFARKSGSGTAKTKADPEKSDEFSTTVPITIDIHSGLRSSLDPETFNSDLIRTRRMLYQQLGVPFPGIHLHFNDHLEENSYTIFLQEIPMADGLLMVDCVLVSEAEDNLKLLGIPYEKGRSLGDNGDVFWVLRENREDLEMAGIPCMSISQALTHHLGNLLRKYAGDFMGLQETSYLLEKMEVQSQELVREVQRVLPIMKITEVFQRLVQEEISIRDLRAILQALIEHGQKEKDVILLTEQIRMALKRSISHKYANDRNVLAVYLFDPDLEEIVRGGIRQTTGGSYLALEPDTMKNILKKLKSEIGNIGSQQDQPVILTAMDIRRYVKKIVEQEYPQLSVLSYQELVPEISIQPIGKISL